MEDDGPPGVPEWVVTYGDMMSLLLTFFIMLVSLSEVKADAKYRAMLESLRAYMGYQGGPVSPPGKNFPMNAVVKALQDLKLGSVLKDKGKGGVKQNAPPADDLRVTRLREGKSQLSGEIIYFANGKADLSPEAIDSIKRTGRKIAGKPHKLEIRAFTDRYVEGIPQSDTERMNLAYQRAEKVMQVLLDEQLLRSRMRIVVYFTNPKGEKTHEQNQNKDRVEITTLDEYSSTFMGKEDDYR